MSGRARPDGRRLGREDLVVVGHPFSPIGMGEHLRSTVQALAAVGLDPAVLDVFGRRRGQDHDLEQRFGPRVTVSLSERINLFCVNGDEIETVMDQLPAERFAKARNIIFPAWELPDYPEVWARRLAAFDEIWAPSSFVQDGLARGTGRPVARIPLAVDLKLSTFLGRRRFGIPEHAFVALFAFDFSSFASRKNPQAVLQVVEDLLRRRPRAPLHLVIKFKGGDPKDPARQALLARIAGLGDRVQTISHEMTDNEVKNLIRCADVFISLHRSEGFGRGMAEAMALGTPVLATGWSGNMDFMDESCAWLVPYALTPTPPDAYPFGEGQVWAEPDVEEAGRQLEAILDDPAEARRRAGLARRKISARFSARAVGLEAADRLLALAEA